MRRLRAVVVIGLAGVIAEATSSCSGKDDDLRYYLGKNGRMYKWEQQVEKAICQLEKNSTISEADRVCNTSEKSLTPAPSYPPR